MSTINDDKISLTSFLPLTNHFLIFAVTSIVHLWQDHKFQCLESLGRIPIQKVGEDKKCHEALPTHL